MAVKKQYPYWVPVQGGKEFATCVLEGVEGGHDGMDAKNGPSIAIPLRKRQDLTAHQYKNGVLTGDRVVLAQTITLIESNAKQHLAIAQEVIGQILPYTGRTIRIGKETVGPRIVLHTCSYIHESLALSAGYDLPTVPKKLELFRFDIIKLCLKRKV